MASSTRQDQGRNRALIVIDVQESFRPAATALGGRLRSLHRRAGRPPGRCRWCPRCPVVWVLHAEPGTGAAFDPAGGHVRPIDGLCPRKGEPIITKPSSNAVTTTKLRQLLTTRGIGELVVWGLRAEQCWETTARVAADLGDEVTFVTDATATFPIPHRGAPTDRTVAESLADP